MFILPRYIIRENISTFVFGFLLTTMVLVLDYLIHVLELIITKGVDVGVVLELFVLNLAWMLALSVPMGSLIGALMAYGRLSGDNEISALKAAGVGPVRLIGPAFVAYTLLAIGMVYFNDKLLPEANHRARMLTGDISRKKPTVTLTANTFLQDFPGVTMLVDTVRAGGHDLDGVTLFDEREGGRPRVDRAKSAHLEHTPDGDTLLLTLHDGEAHILDPAQVEQYRRIRYATQTLFVAGVSTELTRSLQGDRGDREMTIAMMDTQRMRADTTIVVARREMRTEVSTALNEALRPNPAWASTQAPLKLADRWRRHASRERQRADHLHVLAGSVDGQRGTISRMTVEIQKKYALPVACMIFLLLGAPMGMLARRGGMAIGVGLAVFFFVVYWACLIGGEELADRRMVSPMVGMWAGNVLVGGVAAYMLYYARRAGQWQWPDSIDRLIGWVVNLRKARAAS